MKKLSGGERGALAVSAAALALMLGLFGLRASSGAPLDAIQAPAETAAPEETAPEEAFPPAESAPAEPVPEGERVNLNTAGLEELMTLPNIGETRAQAILDDRAANGPYRYPEDLIRVKGIGESTVAGLLDYVTTGG